MSKREIDDRLHMAFHALMATVFLSNPADDCNDPVELRRYMKTCLDKAEVCLQLLNDA